MHSIFPIFPRVATIAFLTAALVSLWTHITSAEDFSPDAPRITAADFQPGSGIHLRIEGATGDYRLQASSDLITWTTLNRFDLPDGLTTAIDENSADATERFYRLVVWLAADGFHLQGDYAEAILAGLNQANSATWTALGITFDASGISVPAVDDLSGADRNARVLAAVIGSLSVLVQTLGDAHFPETDFADLVGALIEDLSSGRLDGTDSVGQPVTVGEAILPALSVTDLLNGLNSLRVDLPGLANVAFTNSGDGSLLISVPAQWGAFHWNGSDWQ